MNRPIITVHDLNLWYGQAQALKNIHIEIPEYAYRLESAKQKGELLAPS